MYSKTKFGFQDHLLMKQPRNLLSRLIHFSCRSKMKILLRFTFSNLSSTLLHIACQYLSQNLYNKNFMRYLGHDIFLPRILNTEMATTCTALTCTTLGQLRTILHIIFILLLKRISFSVLVNINIIFRLPNLFLCLVAINFMLPLVTKVAMK